MITSKVLSEKSKKEQYSIPNNNNKAATSTDTIQKLITINFYSSHIVQLRSQIESCVRKPSKLKIQGSTISIIYQDVTKTKGYKNQ